MLDRSWKERSHCTTHCLLHSAGTREDDDGDDIWRGSLLAAPFVLWQENILAWWQFLWGSSFFRVSYSQSTAEGLNKARKKGVVKVGAVNGNKTDREERVSEASAWDVSAPSKRVTQPLVDSAAETWSDAQAGCLKSDRMIHVKPTNRPRNILLRPGCKIFKSPPTSTSSAGRSLDSKHTKHLFIHLFIFLNPPEPSPPTQRRNCREIRETCSNLFCQVKNGNEQKNHCRRRNLHSNLCSRSEGLWAESAHVVYSQTSDKPGRIKLRQHLIYVRHTHTHITFFSVARYKQGFFYI